MMQSSNLDLTANVKAGALRELKERSELSRAPQSTAGDVSIIGVREQTALWIEALPNSVRPLELSARYPWIADKLCSLWSEPRRCTRYLADLLIARSGTRDAFGVKVSREISGLRLHYATLHPRERGWIDAH